jgi:hypothetical protein
MCADNDAQVLPAGAFSFFGKPGSHLNLLPLPPDYMAVLVTCAAQVWLAPKYLHEVCARHVNWAMLQPFLSFEGTDESTVSSCGPLLVGCMQVVSQLEQEMMGAECDVVYRYSRKGEA